MPRPAEFKASFRMKIEKAHMAKSKVAARAGAKVAKELLLEKIAAWDRKPSIRIDEYEIVTNGGWRRLNAKLVITDRVKTDEGVERIDILEDGRKPLDHDVFPKTRRVMSWAVPYISKTTGELNNNSPYFDPVSAKKKGKKWVDDGWVYTKKVNAGTRALEPMRIVSGVVRDNKQEIIQAMKNAFNAMSTGATKK